MRRELQLREYSNRFPDGNISGAVLYPVAIIAYPMALIKYCGGCAWFVDRETYPSGKIKIVDIDCEKLLSLPVLSWPTGKVPLMEGMFIILKNGKKECITKVKEGDGSPYPLVTNKGQYKWEEVVMVTTISD